MSSIAINITFLDIALMALAVGAPGFVAGAIFSALPGPRSRIVAALLGGIVGFAIGLGSVLFWLYLTR